MTDEEFNSFYNIYNSVIEEKSTFKELFDLSNIEFVSNYEENGFEMNIDQEKGIVSGAYSEDMTFVNVYRNKEYLDFSCQNVSHQIDRDVVARALSGKSTDYVTENLGKTAGELGIDWNTIDRFIKAWENDNNVHYSTDDFTIYYYDYDESGAFYMFGDEQIYISFDKAGQYLEMVAVWQ
jgi:predicted lactoylglutathione lyase